MVKNDVSIVAKYDVSIVAKNDVIIVAKNDVIIVAKNDVIVVAKNHVSIVAKNEVSIVAKNDVIIVAKNDVSIVARKPEAGCSKINKVVSYNFDCINILSKKNSAHWRVRVNSVMTRTGLFNVINCCLEKSFCSQWVLTKLKLNVF